MGKSVLHLTIDTEIKNSALSLHRGVLSQKVENYLRSLILSEFSEDEGVGKTIDVLETKISDTAQKMSELKSQLFDLEQKRKIIVEQERRDRDSLKGHFARHLQSTDAENPDSV